MEISVLQKLNSGIFLKDPFPFLYIKNCLPEKLYRELERNYPSDDEIIRMQKMS